MQICVNFIWEHMQTLALPPPTYNTYNNNLFWNAHLVWDTIQVSLIKKAAIQQLALAGPA